MDSQSSSSSSGSVELGTGFWVGFFPPVFSLLLQLLKLGSALVFKWRQSPSPASCHGNSLALLLEKSVLSRQNYESDFAMMRFGVSL